MTAPSSGESATNRAVLAETSRGWQRAGRRRILIWGRRWDPAADDPDSGGAVRPVGPNSRLAPYSRVADVQAALTFLSAQPEVAADRLGIYGTSYGGATVVWVAAIDPRVRCTVAVVGIGNGARRMRSVLRPDGYYELLERAAADRTRRSLEGSSEFVERAEVLSGRHAVLGPGLDARQARSGLLPEHLRIAEGPRRVLVPVPRRQRYGRYRPHRQRGGGEGGLRPALHPHSQDHRQRFDGKRPHALRGPGVHGGRPR